MESKKKENYSVIHVLSCCEDGGIYSYRLYDDLRIELIGEQKLGKPMYSVIYKDRIYTVLRQPFLNRTDSGVISHKISKDGLTDGSDIISTKGEVGCHLCVANGAVYAANYISGSVIKLPDILREHCGSSVNLSRQSSAHAHFTGVTPDGLYICAVDLGMDKIIIYDKMLNEVSSVSAKAGSGPRHIVFSDDGKYAYCANELSSTVAVYSYYNGKLSYLHEYSTLPTGYNGDNAPAAIRVYNGHVYVSNRGHDSVAVYKMQNDRLICTDIVPCNGQSPRDINIANNTVICANELGNSVTFLSISGDTLIREDKKIMIKRPICICL